MQKRDPIEELLDILACPKCKNELIYNKERQILICNTCKVYYEIVEDIPNMVPEEAKPMELQNT